MKVKMQTNGTADRAIGALVLEGSIALVVYQRMVVVVTCWEVLSRAAFSIDDRACSRFLEVILNFPT